MNITLNIDDLSPMILRAFFLVVLGLLPSIAPAVELTLPGSARQTAGQDLGFDSYALPNAKFDGTEIPSRIFEGFVTRQAWRIEGGGVTPLQLLLPLRDELKKNGYTLIFECASQACGGFDFRFGTDVIDAPDMYVALDDYRFVSAIRGSADAPTAALSLLISRSAAASYIQIIQIAVDKSADISVSKGAEIVGSTQGSGAAANSGSAAQQLDTVGQFVLGDLVFQTGSSNLGEGPFASLSAIAEYLKQNAGRQIALVGHTDAEGSLEGNIALSKRRAGSVRTRLIDVYAVSETQLTAQGVGFLSPVASNLTKAGRTANRRVAAVLISTD